MKRRRGAIILGLVFGGVGASFSGAAQAHFYLHAPAAMTEQNSLGDPQKAPPCGDPGNATQTGIVTTFQAGETITIEIDETIYHPGHYRVALSVNGPNDLPDAPPVTPMGGDQCASTIIQDPPVFPVLADGELLHDSPFDGPRSFEVTLPDDIECDNCTLQVIEYMSSHGGPCFYYHCATIAIEADPNPSSDGTESSTSDGDPSTGDGDGSDTSGGMSAGDAASATNADTTAGETTDAGTEGVTHSTADQNTDDDGGCGCSASTGDGRAQLATLLGLLGLVGFRRRRRR
jgi:MYXO-CTERM domain-containing protein